ncbi:hypothetical protein GCM10025868_12450 [Angustibacter aerolatus]|uniref:Uncharacterized protein n=1 Tax=Angustibacter aerolatus TaxID=1162965 RepID=A0ABQ6JCU4_9ACTN|nr:hypothetical protein [Angustibacter aerolatus]GMA85995.1 hypothetical protein GCM10025868_12450 [Angustibacter aerolatus]
MPPSTGPNHHAPEEIVMTTFRRLVRTVDAWTLDALNAPAALNPRRGA